MIEPDRLIGRRAYPSDLVRISQKWMDPMKVGLLTGGGDCPGLNAVIRAVVQQICQSAVGPASAFWKAARDGSEYDDAATVAETDGIIAQGGRSSGRRGPIPTEIPRPRLPPLRENFSRLELDALMVIGGDDTLGVAIRLHNDFQLPVVGIPKTIDNDLMVTDFSFGFDTAVNIVMEAVDRLRTTTESHRRIVVVETMGRHSGWIACFAGMAVGADYILVPEVPIDLPHLVSVLSKRRAAGKKYGIVIVAEGAKFPDRAPFTLDDHPDPFGNPRLGRYRPRDRRGDSQADGDRDSNGRARATFSAGTAQRIRPHSGHPAGPGRQPVGSSAAVRHDGHAHGRTDRGYADERECRGDENTRPAYYNEAAAFFY